MPELGNVTSINLLWDIFLGEDSRDGGGHPCDLVNGKINASVWEVHCMNTYPHDGHEATLDGLCDPFCRSGTRDDSHAGQVYYKMVNSVISNETTMVRHNDITHLLFG